MGIRCWKGEDTRKCWWVVGVAHVLARICFRRLMCVCVCARVCVCVSVCVCACVFPHVHVRVCMTAFARAWLGVASG